MLQVVNFVVNIFWKYVAALLPQTAASRAQRAPTQTRVNCALRHETVVGILEWSCSWYHWTGVELRLLLVWETVKYYILARVYFRNVRNGFTRIRSVKTETECVRAGC